MERQNRGFYLIKLRVAVQNVDWGRYPHMCQRTYRQLSSVDGTFLYRQSTALQNLFNRSTPIGFGQSGFIWASANRL
jgi:hypothetical protein